MNGLSIFEFDALVSHGTDVGLAEHVHRVPPEVFGWLESQCLRIAEAGEGAWLRLGQRRGRRVVQVTSFVGVIRAPNGFQIEVLPKVGKAMIGSVQEARAQLLRMLCCLNGFRHVRSESAQVLARRMPILEVFITEFLRTVEQIVKRGLRSAYARRQGNLHALKGKLLVATHLRHNQFRADRFFTEHDEFSTDRPENRILHAALRRVSALAQSQPNQQMAAELRFVFADVPASPHPEVDFQRVQLDRSMGRYAEALAWARLILDEESPLTGAGGYRAPSLLFPMEMVFEAFVAKHLAIQLRRPCILKAQARQQHLVRHGGQSWFRMKPDLLIQEAGCNLLVLDTKWKLLDASKASGTDKYGLSQSDFYQLHAYGQNYLDGRGDVVLIYPKTTAFDEPLPVFEFPKTEGLRLWVLPFCLKSPGLLVSAEASFSARFDGLPSPNPV